MNSVLAVYGASGFGREVMPLVRDKATRLGLPKEKCIFVDDHFPAGECNGQTVLTYEEFSKLNSTDKTICIAVADGYIRKKLAEKCTADGIGIYNVQSDNTVKMDDVTLGEGFILCPYVTITSNVSIGVHFHANIYSYVAHDCKIGNFVTFAPGVKCNGNVIVNDHAYVGTGAIIKQGKAGRPTIIGEGAVVGMGAVVTKDVAPGEVVVGNPAKELTKK